MQHLWTPWRMEWIRDSKGLRAPEQGCVLCRLGAEEDDLVVARSQLVYVMLNAYPYNTGHLMVVPFAHSASLEDLDAETLMDLMQTCNRALAALRSLYQPQAFNVGANIGAAAGAGLPDHFHLHIVPRWQGETGFITTIGDTRVIPDTLTNTARELKERWHEQ